ncbi:Hpr(Ser) kinase/phosphatase [Stella humosa]|uniref:Hpr(Ser) kinase/phosphatase n=1 Tax=Stella humosa TaxID=94 RepID=A0A3N1KW26_9PROT|nr:serine/threonine protein kinase [Stella humosa]ROP84144.1 Hpr(Ser) kinase/phosphatase [Stella humosa]BBK33654.1 HPr kinase [Stella humosa]
MADPMQDATRLHATTVAIGRAGVAIEGPSGGGKSDLALRLIDAGARLVADDQTLVERREAGLVARVPASIAGLLEVRGLGIVQLPYVEEVALRLVVVTTPPQSIERLPTPESRELLGVTVPVLRLDPFAVSAAAKVRLAVASLA